MPTRYDMLKDEYRRVLRNDILLQVTISETVDSETRQRIDTAFQSNLTNERRVQAVDESAERRFEYLEKCYD